MLRRKGFTLAQFEESQQRRPGGRIMRSLHLQSESRERRIQMLSSSFIQSRTPTDRQKPNLETLTDVTRFGPLVILDPDKLTVLTMAIWSLFLVWFFNPSTWKAESGRSELKANLVYRMNSGLDRWPNGRSTNYFYGGPRSSSRVTFTQTKHQ